MNLNELLKRYTGVGLGPALLLVLCLAGAGVLVGVFFPKFQAEALLQFPERQHQRQPERSAEDPRLLPEPIAANANLIDLPLYKRVEAVYESTDQLNAWLSKQGFVDSPEGLRLLSLSGSSTFWRSAAVPVLPFSKQDQKIFGEIKDINNAQLLGVQIKTDARTAAQAVQMAQLLAQYFTSAVMRERIRGWVMAGRVESQGTIKTLQANVVKAEIEIGMYSRRVQDMKALLARYPDAARMDARLVVNVNAAEGGEGGERYLSPLAQLVGAESGISQKREEITRLERKIQQLGVLAKFYNEAERAVDANYDPAVLLDALRTQVDQAFAGKNAGEDWVKEARLRLDGDLDNFNAMRSQFGIRSGMRVEAVPSRDPIKLAALGLALGLALLAGLAFLKSALAAMREPNRGALDA